MLAREQALRRYFANRPCTSCHHRQTPEAVLVLVRRPRAWMVMATCGHCHHRGLFVIAFAPQNQTHDAAHASTPIDYRDVREMRMFLDTFNGDFLGLFGQGPQGHIAAD